MGSDARECSRLLIAPMFAFLEAVAHPLDLIFGPNHQRLLCRNFALFQAGDLSLAVSLGDAGPRHIPYEALRPPVFVST